MNINKKEFGIKLKDFINKRKSMQEIAMWIHGVYISYYDNYSEPVFYELLYNLMMMDAGPEFEYSYEELEDIADRLIAGQDVTL